MKKISYWLCLCVCFLFACVFFYADAFCLQSFAYEKQIRIIVDNASIYSVQNFLEVSRQEREDLVLKHAKLHQIFDVVQEFDDMYQIVIEQTQGFVLKSMAIDNAVSSPKKSLNYNAQIIADTCVYEMVGNDYNQTDICLKQGDKVCILDGYDAKKQYTFVSFYDGDVLLNCYVKTEVLKVSGVSSTLIVAISVIVAGCTVASILVKLIVGKQKKAKIKNSF